MTRVHLTCDCGREYACDADVVAACGSPLQARTCPDCGQVSDAPVAGVAYTYRRDSVNLIDAQGETVWSSVPAASRDGLQARQHVSEIVAIGDNPDRSDAARAAFPPRYRATCSCNGLRSPWSTDRADAVADLDSHVCSDRVADVIAAGGALIAISTEVELSACDAVIAAAVGTAKLRGEHRDGDAILLGQDMTRFLNSTPDAGRPSDAARSVCRAYLGNPDAYRANHARVRQTS